MLIAGDDYSRRHDREVFWDLGFDRLSRRFPRARGGRLRDDYGDVGVSFRAYSTVYYCSLAGDRYALPEINSDCGKAC